MPLAQGIDQVIGLDLRGMRQNRILRRLLTSASNIGVAQTVTSFRCSFPIDPTRIENGKSALHDLFGDRAGRKLVLDNRVEPPKQRTIEQPSVIGGSDDQAVALILLQELQEGIENAADLANIVRGCSLSSQGVEFIEQVGAASLLQSIEDQPQLGSRLAHELCDQAVELDGEEREPQFASKHRSGHRLAGARRADQEDLALWRESVLSDAISLALLQKNLLDPSSNLGIKDHIRQPCFGITDRDETGKLAAGLG